MFRLLFYIICITVLVSSQDGGPIIDTSYGSLQGSVKTNRNGKYAVFFSHTFIITQALSFKLLFFIIH